VYADLPAVRQELQKNEDTWCGMPGHLRCRIRCNPESIQGMVAREAFRAILMAIRISSTRTEAMMVAG